MFFPSKEVRIFVCHTPADMRKSFNGLCGVARDLMSQDPDSGALFVFINRRKDMVKILWYERDGYEIWMKRKDEGCYRVNFSDEPGATLLDLPDLSLLLKSK